MSRRLTPPPAQPRQTKRSQLEEMAEKIRLEHVEQWNREFGPAQRYELGELVLTVGEKPADKTAWLGIVDTETDQEILVLGYAALELLREALDRIHPPF